MSSDGASRRRQILFQTLLALFGMSFVLIAGEVMVRLVDPPVFKNPIRIYDPDFGWRAIPNMVIYRPLSGRIVRFDANDIGFRDRNHSKAQQVGGREKRRDIRRIMIFGDSFTESAQVELHETFWSMLKDRLNARQDDVYWEVQSFGVGDWGTTQEWLAFKKYGHLADLVILQVFPLNDIANNSLDAANLASSQDAYRPYFNPKTNYTGITYVNPRTTWLRQKTRLGRFLVQLAIQTRGPWGEEQVFKTLQDRFDYSNLRAQELGLPEDARFPALLFNSLTYDPEQYEIFRSGWKATDVGIRRIVNLAKGRKAKSIVLVVPHSDQLRPLSKRLTELPYPVRPDYAEKRIANLLKDDEGVSVIGLLESFEANRDTVLPYLEGHFNRPTHVLVTDQLEAEVLRLFPD